MITDKQIAEALDRIARTPDGWLLYLSLERTLTTVMETPDSGALLTHNGQRILASRIRAMMSKGIEESGRGADHVITFAVAGPRAVADASRGTKPRFTIPSDSPSGGGNAPSGGY